MVTRILIFMMVVLSLARCGKDTETFIPNPIPSQFTASVFVEVFDVNGLPLEDVQIDLGGALSTTNEDGLVYLKNVAMSGSTYVTAEKSGFFHGSRRFYPSPDKTHFIKIMLLSDQVIGTVESGAGGTINLANGTSLVFPANAIVDQSGNSYNGTVSVSAQPIQANDPNLSIKMPGDLVGETVSGERGSLGSMGMMTVELKSGNGDILQVKSGASVEMRMDVPDHMVDNAPSTIPMWYFDEETGFWKEEGEATLEGNTYVAQVGHFSYWNYDAWFPAVKWGATFVYDDGSPASQVEVCITIINLETTKCAYTNAEGAVCGLVAANEPLLMEVRSPCGDIILSQQIGPFSDSTMTGPYTIQSTTVILTEVTGNAINCNGDLVTDGYARINVNGSNYFAVLDSVTGEFELTVQNCDETDVVITVVDRAGVKQSLPQTFDFAPVIDAGTITVCETIQEFIDIEVTGFPDHFVFFFPYEWEQEDNVYINAADSSITSQKYVFFRFQGTTPGTYTPQGFEIGMELPTTEFANATALTIMVTYFGGHGDYIQGTLSGTLNTGPNNGNDEYPFTGTFSVLRN
jgi:hypothetical protein